MHHVAIGLKATYAMSDTVATVQSSIVLTGLKQSKEKIKTVPVHNTIFYRVYVHVHMDVGIQFHSLLILALDRGLSIIINRFYYRHQHSFSRTCPLEMFKNAYIAILLHHTY
jgi:hypothetical protein